MKLDRVLTEAILDSHTLSWRETARLLGVSRYRARKLRESRNRA